MTNWVAAALALGLGACSCLAQYRLLPGDTASDFPDCFPKTPARFCLGSSGTERCFAPASTKNYIFGLEPKATPVGELDGNPLTLFSAVFSGCGSGTLTDFSLLSVHDGEIVNLLPTVRLTDQSEFKLWNLAHITKLPVLVTADFIWDFAANESHFARHRYAIRAYVFETKSGRYREAVKYETTRKYPGLDETGEVKVLEAERAIILARVR